MNLWDELLVRLEQKVGSHSFATWFRPTRFVSQQGARLCVHVPNGEFKEWLARNYQGAVDEALRELGRPDLQVEFVWNTLAEVPETALAADRQPLPAPSLNPKYTFDSFV